jgi:hypothetical protein
LVATRSTLKILLLADRIHTRAQGDIGHVCHGIRQSQEKAILLFLQRGAEKHRTDSRAAHQGNDWIQDGHKNPFITFFMGIRSTSFL